MKLVEKIQQSNSGKPDDYSKIYSPTAEVIEQIADDYAIEFLIWASQFALQRFEADRWQVLGLADFGFTKTVSTREILEEFKKEKGL